MAPEFESTNEAVTSSEKKIKYTDHGYTVCARKWLGRELAKHPSAFTIYFHLVNWANHKDGKLRRGQIALGERDFGEILGMSVITVRKWLRWLQANGWILLKPINWGKERGTIVTVLNYDLSQDFHTYALPSEDQKMILTPGSEDQKMILTIPFEDQKMILDPPFEDQKMIPHILHNSIKSGLASNALSQRCPTGQISGDEDKGVRVPPDTIQKPIIGRAALDAELQRRKVDREKGKVGKGEECNFRA